MSPFKLAWLNLSRRKIQSLIAIISIAVSVASSGVLLRVYLLSKSRFQTLAHAGDAIIGAKSGELDILLSALNLEGEYPGFLPQKLFESIRSMDSVKFEDGVKIETKVIQSVSPLLFIAKLPEQKNLKVFATDESFLNLPNQKLQEGSLWTKPLSIIIGQELAKNFNLKIHSSVPAKLWFPLHPENQNLKLNEMRFEVSGILQSTHSAWDHAAFLSLSTAKGILAQIPLGSASIWGPEVLNYFIITLNPNLNSKDRSQAQEQIEGLINKRSVAQIVWIEPQIQMLEKLLGNEQILGLLISAMVMLLGGLGITGVMFSRFDSMNLQIAVVRAIGLSRKEVAFWLLSEGFILGFISVLIGAFIDAVAFPMLQPLLGKNIPQIEWLEISIFSSYGVWLVALFAAICSVSLPLMKILKQDVHSSLRSL